MKNNHMRIILCLFMCCALLFTCVARPASATSVAVVAGLAAIPTAVAVACAFQALGVMSGSSSSAFTSGVNSCSSWLSDNSNLVVNGTVALLGLTQAGSTVSYLNKSFVQDVWQWLFSGQTFKFSDSYSTYYTTQACSSYAQAISYASHCPRAFRGTYYSQYTGYQDCVIITSDSEYVRLNGTTLSIIGYGTNHSVYTGGTSWEVRSSSTTYSYTNVTELSTTPFVTTSDDLQLGQVQSPYIQTGTEEETIQIEIAPIYIDWTKYGVPDPNDPGGDDPDNDGKFPMWLPTGIPSPGYDDSVITQNQQQAQSGVVSGDITFEPYEPDDPGSGGGGAGSGTDLSSVIQAIINVPTAIVTGIGNFISDFFGFNGKPDDYLIQLRDFFPFCIPFDLYDFITVLSAEPEAPVFHWEIPVPQLGQTFELEVDLSAWDDIALLFRNFELLAFIFGLAIITREKFLRS